MDNYQESVQYWNLLLQSLADSSPIDDLYPEISSPMLATCTPMIIDEPAEPWKVVGDHGDKEAAAEEKTAAKDEDTNMNEVGESSTQEAMEKGKEKEEGVGEESEDTKTLSKRTRAKELRRINDKRRRIDIRNKVDKLKELTRCHSKKDLFSTIEAVVDSVRELKFWVESGSPWTYPYLPPNYFMPFNHFTPGETSGSANQILPYTYQRFNNQPPFQPSHEFQLPSQPHYQPPSQPSQFQPPSQPSQYQPPSQPSQFQPPSQPSQYQPPSQPSQIQPPQFQPPSQPHYQPQYQPPFQPQSSKPL